MNRNKTHSIAIGVLVILVVLISGIYFGIKLANKQINHNNLLVSNETAKQCPSSCDDSKICTDDVCSVDTNYACINTPLSSCCGNAICEDGENITSCALDCNRSEKITSNVSIKYAIHNYTYQNINQSIDTRSNLENLGPVRVKLVKIGKEAKGDLMRIRVYWEIYNMGPDDVYINPHMDTLVLGIPPSNIRGYSYWKGYSSTPIYLNGEKQPDDLMVNESSYFGNLKSAKIISGGVIVENIPVNITTARKIKVRLSIQKFSDFTFDIPIERIGCTSLIC